MPKYKEKQNIHWRRFKVVKVSSKPHPKFVIGKASTANKMKAVNMLEFLKALVICKWQESAGTLER